MNGWIIYCIDNLYLQMQYYFDLKITEKEKLKLKNITCNIKEDVAIYFSQQIIDFTDEFSNIPSGIDVLHFNNPLITFIISKDIFTISDHLESIILFITNLKRCYNKQYYICLNKIDDNNINVIVHSAINSIDNNLNYIVLNKFDKIIDYSFEIVDNNVSSVKNLICSLSGSKTQTFFLDKICYYPPYKLLFDNVICSNLIDQYNDFISSRKSLNMNIKMNNVNVNFETNLQINKIEIVTKSRNIIIGLKNEFNFNKLDAYLIKKFGYGKYEYEVDLNTEEEKIKYVVD